ncbi:MAG: hypothetical protein ACREHG_00600 [Candidatus Saccharimonadales bacterium]
MAKNSRALKTNSVSTYAQTNSVIDVGALRRQKLHALVNEEIGRQRASKRRQDQWKMMHGMGGEYAICATCGGKMKKSLADSQLLNAPRFFEWNQKKAPCCMACIMGIPRKKYPPRVDKGGA